MSPRAILSVLAAGSVVAAACSDPTEPALPAFSISPVTQWSGGTITVRSPYFVARNPLPVVTVGAETLAVTRQDDSTLATTLPRGPSGLVTLSLARGTQRDSLATVQRVGFRELRIASVPLSGELFAADSAGKPLVFGGFFNGTGDREPVLRLTVATAQSLVLGGLRQPSNTFYGMAPSISAGVFAVRDSTDSLRLANLFAAPAAVTGTVPWVGTSFSRQASLLSSGLWLFTGAHSTYTKQEADSTEPARVAVESPYGVFMSPRGDRTTLAALVAGTPGNEGVPVFDNATGLVAYRLPLTGTQDATFSSDGAALFVVGGSAFATDTLAAVDATTGSLLHPKVKFPDGFHALGVAYRAGAGGQVLVAAANPSTLALLVYRASTLDLLGILPTIDNCGPNLGSSACLPGVVVVDNAQNAAYIVVPGTPTPIWTFDLLGTP